MNEGRRTVLAAVSEAAWQRQVEAWAQRGGWAFFHANACEHYRRNQAGFPDLALRRHGRVIFAELKAARGRLTPEQQAWIEDLRWAMIETYIWRPSDAEEVERILTEGAEGV